MIIFARYQIMQLYGLVTGRHILVRLKEQRRTQWLSRAELEHLQKQKLYLLLSYAYRYVPYYQHVFDQIGFKPEEILTDISHMSRIPVLTKDIIRQNFNDLLTTEPDRKATLSRLRTSGSTGFPLVFMQDYNFRDNVTAGIFRHLEWSGWELGLPHAYIWGADFEATSSESLRTQLMDWTLNRFNINAYMMTEAMMEAFAQEVRQRQPYLLFGYVSSLYRFAQFVRENNYHDIEFSAIFSAAEVLYSDQREYIEETFQCKIYNRYATRDLGDIACECAAHQGLHVSIDNIYLEIYRDLNKAELTEPGERGELVVTNLNNYGMPFIRYQIGDVGAWSQFTRCPCRRELPLMEMIEGRELDLFKTHDGRFVWGGFAGRLFGMEGIKQFQMVQKSLDHVLVRIVKEAELDQTKLAEIKRTVHTALGDHVKVTFEYPDEIPILPSGKHRYAISEITD